MNKYIFPGADASLPAASMLKPMEKAGFEMHSMENITHHYGWTDPQVARQLDAQQGQGRRCLR